MLFLRRRLGLKRLAYWILLVTFVLMVKQLLLLQTMDGFMEAINQQSVESLRMFYVADYSSLHKRFITEEKACDIAQQPKVETDIQMYDLLTTKLKIEGGWGQSLSTTINASAYSTERPLQVFVVPHSHCDPGWLKTFEAYHKNHTTLILNNMVKKLQQHDKMTFIYAEMSFFQKWWAERSEADRQVVRRLMSEGRFEIPTGGWVMPDEANSHYYALINQLTEGQQWMVNHVGVRPRSGWAIDPFGHSPTMAYLTQGSGLENILIQRIHYAVKKHLAKGKNFEFIWKQNWDHTGESDVFTHMMPYSHYDHLNTCGPSSSTCCMYDFRRQPGWITCSGKYAIPVTEANVKERSETILRQYKQKASLYRSGVVLIPLGDDFRYMTEIEWDQQYENYKKIMDYVNSHPELHTNIQFGTLSDYFDAVRARSGHQGDYPTGFPTLSGDFFSYSDMGKDYWTGYFTSRPYYKRLDRVLEYHLRSSEILFSTALLHARHGNHSDWLPWARCTQLLMTSRRALGLFQHHDGVTGTAKDHVVKDYGVRMLEGINNAKEVIQKSAAFLLSSDPGKTGEVTFDLDETRFSHDTLPARYILELTEPRKVTFYNSLSHDRVSVVSVYVSTPHVSIMTADNQILTAIQVSPHWITESKMSLASFKVSFAVDVRALSLCTYTITATQPQDSLAVLSNVHLYNTQLNTTDFRPFVIEHKKAETISIENEYFALKLNSSSGLLHELVSLEDDITTKLELDFITYTSRGGAYLFIPKGAAVPVKHSDPYIRVTKGPVYTEVRVLLHEVDHTVTLYKTPGVEGQSIDIQNRVDVRDKKNQELAMRVRSGVQNKDREFYTDLNGFQISKRKYVDKLPLEGNFYPMTSYMFLEDATSRLSLVSGQSLGVSSQKQGEFEVMLDRRLMQDDRRGLEQGVTDNKKTPNRFKLIFERKAPAEYTVPDKPISYPTMLCHLSHQYTVHPLFHLPHAISHSHPSSITHSPAYQGYNPAKVTKFRSEFTALTQQLPCDIEVVNLRTLTQSEDNVSTRFLPRDQVGLLLHRLGVDCRYPMRGVSCGVHGDKLSLTTLLSGLNLNTVYKSTLTFLGDDVISAEPEADLQPMTLSAYRLLYR